MPQTLLKPLIVAPGFAASAFCAYAAPASSGVSEGARFIDEKFSSLVRHLESYESLFGAKARLLSELQALARECAEDDWDGYGARAVSGAVVCRAEFFIRSLPEGIPLPEIAAEPDGQISLDWLPSRTRTFTLSVNEGNRLAYAWIDGTNRGHAVASFEGKAPPVRILEELQRIVSNGASLRTA